MPNWKKSLLSALFHFLIMVDQQSYKSYIIDIHLPPAIIVDPLLLSLGYALVLIFDFILIKNDTKHFILPIFFATKYDFGNISFMMHPWSLAAQIVFLAKSELSLTNWLKMLIKTATFQDDSPTTETSTEIRLAGLKKLIRGLAKFVFMKLFLDGVLPVDILAVRIYCMLGVTDVLMGVVQSLFLIRFKDVFNNPFIASRSVYLFAFVEICTVNGGID